LRSPSPVALAAASERDQLTCKPLRERSHRLGDAAALDTNQLFRDSRNLVAFIDDDLPVPAEVDMVSAHDGLLSRTPSSLIRPSSKRW
jgi:hypothetical protein